MTKGSYSSRLGAGLAMLEETRIFLDLWQPGMQAADLQRLALESGRFPNVSARRLRNLVAGASHCATWRRTAGRQPC